MVESERDSIKYCSSHGRRVPVEVTVKKETVLHYFVTLRERRSCILQSFQYSASHARTTHHPRRFSDWHALATRFMMNLQMAVIAWSYGLSWTKCFKNILAFWYHKYNPSMDKFSIFRTLCLNVLELRRKDDKTWINNIRYGHYSQASASIRVEKFKTLFLQSW